MAVMTFMLAEGEGAQSAREGVRCRGLTLPPFSTTVWHLRLDDLENVELESRMRDLEDALEDGLQMYPG